MSLREYFVAKDGHGVLATADAKGKVDVAVYAEPYAIDDGMMAFIMADRLSLANVRSNPSAAYLFIEAGGGYSGKRFYLTRVKEAAPAEIEDRELAGKMDKALKAYKNEKLTMVYFRVDKVLPLVGDRE